MSLTFTEWNGDEVKKLLHKTVQNRIKAIGILGVNDIKEHINHEGAHKGAGGKLVYGASTSAPGEDPYKQHGDLIKSIAYNYEPDTLTLRIGTGTLIGKFLELGTKRMAARPFLRNFFSRARDKIVKVFHGTE